MRALTIDRVLGGLEVLLQFVARRAANQFQHDGNAAGRCWVIHGHKIFQDSVFINSMRCYGLLPSFESHFRSAAVKRLVECIEQGLFQCSDTDLSAWTVVAHLNAWDESG